MITTPDPLAAARAAALFVSDLSPTDHPTNAEIEAAIKHSLRTHGGTRGCAADVAATYGDYPELAAPRMRWARSVIANLHDRHVPANAGIRTNPASPDRRPTPTPQHLTAAA